MSADPKAGGPPPLPRQFAAVNWLGVRALFRRGALRYLKLAWESLGGPCISSLLFLAVFALAAGERGEMVPGISVVQFIAPGVVMFTMAHAGFEYAAFPLLDDKLEGMIGDILAAPITPLEMLAGYVLPAAWGALLTGAAVLTLGLLFVDLRAHSVPAVLGFAVAGALLFALLGTLAGLWADRWEHYAMVESFLVLPLGFLSGTFFTLAALPEPARLLITFNPVFYAVDGFRYGLTGHGESGLALGMALLLAIILALGLVAWRLFAIGYKIKP